MIGQTNGATGGAGTLLKIKAYATLPASGKYGNVAVITTTPVKYWELGPEEPTTRSDGNALQAGDVFIKIATGDDLNLVKRNAIRVSLASCKQYTDGAWVNVAAYYFSTAWQKFSDVLLYLMRDGVFSSDYTFKAATGSWDTADPYVVENPYTTSWVWAYSSDGYRQKIYSDNARWLKLSSLCAVGSFSKIGIRYSLQSYDTTVCQFGYNTATSDGTSVADFTITPKYTTLTGSGIDTVLTAYINIDSGHTNVTPFIHVYNADMRVYDIWLE